MPRTRPDGALTDRWAERPSSRYLARGARSRLLAVRRSAAACPAVGLVQARLESPAQGKRERRVADIIASACSASRCWSSDWEPSAFETRAKPIRMYRKRSFATGEQWRPQTSAAVCRRSRTAVSNTGLQFRILNLRDLHRSSRNRRHVSRCAHNVEERSAEGNHRERRGARRHSRASRHGQIAALVGRCCTNRHWPARCQPLRARPGPHLGRDRRSRRRHPALARPLEDVGGTDSPDLTPHGRSPGATAGTPRPRQPARLPPRQHPRPPLAHGVVHRLSGGCSEKIGNSRRTGVYVCWEAIWSRQIGISAFGLVIPSRRHGHPAERLMTETCRYVCCSFQIFIFHRGGATSGSSTTTCATKCSPTSPLSGQTT